MTEPLTGPIDMGAATAVIRELLAGGAHDGPCANVDGQGPDYNEYDTCALHLAAAGRRRVAAEAFLTASAGRLALGGADRLPATGAEVSRVEAPGATVIVRARQSGPPSFEAAAAQVQEEQARQRAWLEGLDPAERAQVEMVVAYTLRRLLEDLAWVPGATRLGANRLDVSFVVEMDDTQVAAARAAQRQAALPRGTDRGPA